MGVRAAQELRARPQALRCGRIENRREGRAPRALSDTGPLWRALEWERLARRRRRRRDYAPVRRDQSPTAAELFAQPRHEKDEPPEQTPEARARQLKRHGSPAAAHLAQLRHAAPRGRAALHEARTRTRPPTPACNSRHADVACTTSAARSRTFRFALATTRGTAPPADAAETRKQRLRRGRHLREALESAGRHNHAWHRFSSNRKTAAAAGRRKRDGTGRKVWLFGAG